MKTLVKLLSAATALESEIAGLTDQQSTLAADVERLTAAGDISEKSLDDLVRKRGRIDLLPAAIAKREERLDQLTKEVRAAAATVRDRCRAELRAREDAGRAQIESVLAPLIPDANARAKIVAEAVPLLPSVQSAASLLSTADYAASFSSGLPHARAFIVAIESYAKTSKFSVEFP